MIEFNKGLVAWNPTYIISFLFFYGCTQERLLNSGTTSSNSVGGVGAHMHAILRTRIFGPHKIIQNIVILFISFDIFGLFLFSASTLLTDYYLVNTRRPLKENDRENDEEKKIILKELKKKIYVIRSIHLHQQIKMVKNLCYKKLKCKRYIIISQILVFNLSNF